MRLYILVEGQTEERFVKGMLVGHLAAHGVWAHVVTVMTSRSNDGTHRKGGGDWQKWHRHLERLLGQGKSAGIRVTTLFDLYGLPRDFPRLSEARRIADTVARVAVLEDAMSTAVDDRRFIPYLQRHEVEALVLAGLDALATLVEPDDGVDALRKDMGATPPEDVNDGEQTAPSKRLLRLVPGYQKTVHGPLVLEAVGLAKLRAACPRFGAWVSKLENLAHP